MHSTSNLIDQTSPYISGYNQYGLPVFPFIATTKTKLKGTVYLHTLSSFMSAYLYGTVDPQLVHGHSLGFKHLVYNEHLSNCQ